MTTDAIVIGAGPNGLVAANVLADAGRSVLLVEANDDPGGAVRTAELTAPGFRNDMFSAFYPMTAASPVIAELGLDRYGLSWTHAPTVLAHPRTGRPAAMLSRDLDTTAASLDRAGAGDGARFRHQYERWCRVSEPLMGSLLRPFPPVRHLARLVASAGLADTFDLADCRAVGATPDGGGIFRRIGGAARAALLHHPSVEGLPPSGGQYVLSRRAGRGCRREEAADRRLGRRRGPQP